MSVTPTRYFTKEGASPFENIEWDIEFPKQWSATSREIAATKYFRKSAGDHSLRDLIERVTGAIRKAGEWQGYFKEAKAARIFEEELQHLMLHQMAAFNSPAWFNLGVFPKAHMAGRSENWAWDFSADAAKPLVTAYVRPQVSACFIQNLEDDLLSIYDLLKSEARLFKFGSGTGTNFSKLRSKWEPLEMGGSSCGVLSYLEIFDKSAQAIKSGGTSRRAAKMVILDADHPEIEEFVEWKVNEERKARVLIASGYESGFEGEAYRSISGQNSNNSVRVSDEFMRKVESGSPWELKSRLHSTVVKTLPADELFEKICRAAWECADPGLQFHDTINRWHLCPNEGEIRASNPCSEFMFIDDSACNLASLNLVRFLDEKGRFLFSDFERAIEWLILAQDILVDYASYPTEKICENSHRLRPLGLGYANLGGLLMSLGIPYESKEAVAWATLITATLHAKALRTSAMLAKAKGGFEGSGAFVSRVEQVLEMHAEIWKERQKSLQECFSQTHFEHQQIGRVSQMWDALMSEAVVSGFRNAQVTLLAPTGTIGLFMDCDTLGIEPDFALVKNKKLVGGGQLRLVNHSLGRGLRRLGYASVDVAAIEQFVQKNNTVVGAPHIREEHFAVFDTALAPQRHSQRRISAQGHLAVMEAAQAFLSGAISKTINLPKTATPEDVKEIYLQAWKRGLKSVAIYRDESKSFQPLCLDC